MKFDRVVIIQKLDNKEDVIVKHIASSIIHLVDEYNIPVVLDSNSTYNSNTLFIAVGGDGTMLYTLKKAAAVGALAIGVNAGKVGFLTDVFCEQLFATLAPLLSDQSYVPPILLRMMLKTSVCGSEFISMNELTIAHSESDTILNFGLFIDGEFAGSHRANSVVISTPTGSTAYALSAGGAILHPSMEAIEIVPVASLKMASRPIVVSGHSTIRIEAKYSQGLPVVIRSDGQKAFVQSSDTKEVEITVKQSDQKAKAILSKDWNFFDVLSTKMGWLS
jgi:NAD+ kinase